MIEQDAAGFCEMWFRVPEEDALELRVALAILGEQTDLINALAVTAEDLDGGGVLLTWPIGWDLWQQVIRYNGDDETEARIQLGRGRVSGIIGAAAMFNPGQAARLHRPS